MFCIIDFFYKQWEVKPLSLRNKKNGVLHIFQLFQTFILNLFLVLNEKIHLVLSLGDLLGNLVMINIPANPGMLILNSFTII